MSRIYRYILVNDGGMAPDPRGGVLSLATCKPVIRSVAKPGDWVIGCYPSPNNTVVSWAGLVIAVLPIHEYSERYPQKHDALYTLSEEGLIKRVPGKHNWYHPKNDQQRKDMKGRALLFYQEQSWYFGIDGRSLPESLVHLAPRSQGHRVNGRLEGDLEGLIDWLATQGLPTLEGRPRHGWEGPGSSGCGRIRPRKRGC